LKLFAQNLFYSFASNVPYAWQRASSAELYQLIGWQVNTTDDPLIATDRD
jgi:hypothetical protein